ncbi:MAG: hypothetical protein QGG55_00875, partial [Verrucomicrobiota bacterium]|nr:hypothetical protein [Verrucomicrobiota bacterium]
HKKLVLKDKLATDTWAWTRGRKYAGEFNIGAEIAEGRTLKETEEALYAQLEKLKTEPVPAKEVQKVKNNFAAAEYRRLSSNHPILMAIMRAEGTSGWRAINESGPKLQAVTPADIQRVAKKYFTRENRAVAIYKRKPGTGGGGDPLLAGLTGEQKAMARKIKASITAEKDLTKLKEQLKGLEGRLEQAGTKAPPLMKVVRDILRKRISEMEKKK